MELGQHFTVKYGIDEAKRQEAFQQVRKEMLQGSSSFERHTGLYEAIRQLSVVQSKLLLTNSPENTGREFIAALGASVLFSDIIYGAGKPVGMEQFMSELMKREGLRPEQILSIGDHAWNDLYPVRKLGGRTAWISAYPSSDPSPWDVRLTTLDELASLWQIFNIANINTFRGGTTYESESSVRGAHNVLWWVDHNRRCSHHV